MWGPRSVAPSTRPSKESALLGGPPGFARKRVGAMFHDGPVRAARTTVTLDRPARADKTEMSSCWTDVSGGRQQSVKPGVPLVTAARPALAGGGGFDGRATHRPLRISTTPRPKRLSKSSRSWSWSQTFPARPSSIPDIRDFAPMASRTRAAHRGDEGTRAVTQTVNQALLDAAGPTGTIRGFVRIFPEHVEVDVLNSEPSAAGMSWLRSHAPIPMRSHREQPRNSAHRRAAKCRSRPRPRRSPTG